MLFLRSGSIGPDVRRVQEALNNRMLPPGNRITSPPMQRLAEDGIFGPKTAAMVKEFQRLNKIAVDGIVGSDTSYLLFPYITFTAQLLAQPTGSGGLLVMPGGRFLLDRLPDAGQRPGGKPEAKAIVFGTPIDGGLLARCYRAARGWAGLAVNCDSADLTRG